MDTGTLNTWRGEIRRVLQELAAIPYAEPYKLTKRVAFDDDTNTYAVIVHGWEGPRRLHGCLAHIEINGDKIWIQQDGTEYGLATELVEAGIPKESIVLGFKSEWVRPHTGFAVA
ncbi:MAG: XisI protein [Planctomycetes bacterium]|nr:XisI protein [Planctomycetota bacterium]